MYVEGGIRQPTTPKTCPVELPALSARAERAQKIRLSVYLGLGVAVWQLLPNLRIDEVVH